MWSVIQGLEALLQNPQRTGVGYYFAWLNGVTSWLDLFLRSCLPSAETILCPEEKTPMAWRRMPWRACRVVMEGSERHPSCTGTAGF